MLQKIAVLLAYNTMTVFRVSYLCIILPKKSSLGYSLSFHKEIWAPYSSADEAGTHLCPSTDTSVFPCQPWGNWSGKQPILLRLENCNPNSSGAKRFPSVWVLSVPCIQQGRDSEKQNVTESENVWERTCTHVSKRQISIITQLWSQAFSC